MFKIPSKIFLFFKSNQFFAFFRFFEFSDFHILDLELSFTGWSKWLRRSSFQFLESNGMLLIRMNVKKTFK